MFEKAISDLTGEGLDVEVEELEEETSVSRIMQIIEQALTGDNIDGASTTITVNRTPEGHADVSVTQDWCGLCDEEAEEDETEIELDFEEEDEEDEDDEEVE